VQFKYPGEEEEEEELSVALISMCLCLRVSYTDLVLYDNLVI
jgi:hypothetical protein